MKGATYKDCWDVDLGVTYIPWESIPSDLSSLTDGGILDEDSVPDHLKDQVNKDGSSNMAEEESQDGTVNMMPTMIPMMPGYAPMPGETLNLAFSAGMSNPYTRLINGFTSQN